MVISKTKTSIQIQKCMLQQLFVFYVKSDLKKNLVSNWNELIRLTNTLVYIDEWEMFMTVQIVQFRVLVCNYVSATAAELSNPPT